jgi:Uma2 family endonuclease
MTATLEKNRKTQKSLTSAFAMPDPAPLENGEHLTRAEFHRRFLGMPSLKRAELIEGIVIMGSPVSAAHANAHGILGGILFQYATNTAGVVYCDNATVRMDADNEVQPDGLLRVEPEAGGRSRLTEDGFYEGVPEFIAEVTVSSSSYDFHEKLNVYRRNGVREYLIWQPSVRRLEWLKHREGQYVPMPARADGLICSDVFPGLWIDAEALVAGNVRKVLTRLQKGFRSAAHGEFVRRIAGK